MPTNQGDFTGRQKAKLAKEAAAKQSEARERMSLITQEERVFNETHVVDATNPNKQVILDNIPDLNVYDATEGNANLDPVVVSPASDRAAPLTSGDVVIDEEVERAEPEEKIRLSEDIEAMTLGAGNHFTFKAGTIYVVKKHVADHLRNLGFLPDF